MTVEEIRKIPIGPSASEVVFPDRASIAVFDADAFLPCRKRGWQRRQCVFTTTPSAWIRTPARVLGQYSGGRAVLKTGEVAAGRFWQALAQTAKRYGLTEHKVSVKSW